MSSKRFAVAATAMMFALSACSGIGGSDSGTDATSQKPVEGPQACSGTFSGECTPVAFVDLDGSGRNATVDVTSTNGRPIVRVRLADSAQTLDQPVSLQTATMTSIEPDIPGKIAFYDLDGRPGAEIVVPVGMFGSNAVFQVYAVRDGALRVLTPPGDTLDLKFGTGHWVFPGERLLARAMCRAGGLSLGSAEMPAPERGRVVDFTSRPGSERGEASEWIAEGKPRSVPAAEVTDLSVGQQHFKCVDQRAASVTFGDAAGTPSSTTTASSPEPCDATRDLSAQVAAALRSLPAPPIGEWQDSADRSELKPCAELSFATTTVEMATNSSPVAIMLFHRGESVGVATRCFPPIRSVTHEGDDTVVVTYRFPNEGDSNAGMTGTATLRFQWSGGEVVKSGDVPARLTQLAGCTP